MTSPDPKLLVRLLQHGGPTTDPTWRLVACPPSGAGAQYYRPLVRPDIELWSMRYPGRESRFGEPFATSIPALAHELSTALLPMLRADELPTVLLGHSMGVGVAAETAVRVERELPGRLGLLALSARAAPGSRDHIEDDRMRRIASDDAALLEWLGSLGGTPRELLDDDDFMAMQLPILRADLLASLVYTGPDPSRPLPVPLLLLCGDADPAVEADDLAGWAQLTRGRVTRLTLHGGHHALLDDSDRALAAMAPRPDGALE